MFLIYYAAIYDPSHFAVYMSCDILGFHIEVPLMALLPYYVC